MLSVKIKNKKRPRKANIDVRKKRESSLEPESAEPLQDAKAKNNKIKIIELRNLMTKGTIGVGKTADDGFKGKSAIKKVYGIFEVIKKKLKKRKNTSQDLIDEISKEKEEDEKEQEKKQEEETGSKEADGEKQEEDKAGFSRGKSPEILGIKVEIDKIKAQNDALIQTRKATGERFIKVSEELGELRGNIMDLDKDMREIMLRVSKSIDLVETVQPENLYSEIKRQDAKIESNVAKIDGNKDLSNKIMEELKDMRSKISLFRGVEQVIKLNKEVEKKLIDIQKIKSIVEGHSDKVENVFTEVEKKFKRFENFEKTAEDIKKVSAQSLSGIEKMKITVGNYITKEEIKDVQDETIESYKVVLSAVNDMKGDVAEALEKVALINPEQIKNINSFVDEIEAKRKVDNSEIKAKIMGVHTDVSALRRRIDKIAKMPKQKSSARKTKGALEKAMMNSNKLKKLSIDVRNINLGINSAAKEVKSGLEQIKKEKTELHKIIGNLKSFVVEFKGVIAKKD